MNGKLFVPTSIGSTTQNIISDTFIHWFYKSKKKKRIGKQYIIFNFRHFVDVPSPKTNKNVWNCPISNQWFPLRTEKINVAIIINNTLSFVCNPIERRILGYISGAILFVLCVYILVCLFIYLYVRHDSPPISDNVHIPRKFRPDFSRIKTVQASLGHPRASSTSNIIAKTK